MIDILNEFIATFGLTYEPVTFADMFAWLVLVMIACSMLSGIIRTLLTLPLNLHRRVR